MSLELAPGTVVTQDHMWTMAVNRNQNLLGKLMLVANRPAQSVRGLRQDEWSDLHRQIDRATKALEALFRVDHFNFAFLMNVDAQVHFHVIPRYRHERDWNGLVFYDHHFGAMFGGEERLLDVAALGALAAAIRSHLPPAA